jgi:predicted Fe-Mo cluster-binding NifX family protein
MAMKVAVAASGENLQARADPRFGRCPYFVVVDAGTMEFEAIPNPGGSQGSGAGIAAAQVVARTDAEAIIADNFGPNAFQTLIAGGLKVFSGATGTVEDAVRALLADELEPVETATVRAHFGMPTRATTSDAETK